jgi:hypothetical protein
MKQLEADSIVYDASRAGRVIQDDRDIGRWMLAGSPSPRERAGGSESGQGDRARSQRHQQEVTQSQRT